MSELNGVVSGKGATDDDAGAPKAPRRARGETRIAGEPGLVLHTYPYKETSLIIEALTRHHGRIALVARGARRPRSALRGLLQAFQPLSLSFSLARPASGAELGNLHGAEWLAGIAALGGPGLICGFYLNELIIKLLARHDAHEQLFDAYWRSIAALAAQQDPAPVLRAFEYTLLCHTGYALQLDQAADGTGPIEQDGLYRYVHERGPVLAHDRLEEGTLVRGKTLRDIAGGDYSDAVTLSQSKLLMRQLLNHQLSGQPLQTRQMMIELQDI